MSWFPRPTNVANLWLGPYNPTEKSLDEWFTIWTNPQAKELRNKVGVAGNLDGSGKATTRLLLTDSWLLKLDLAKGVKTLEAAKDHLKKDLKRHKKFPIWHPKKTHFVIHHETNFYVASACPFLKTFRTYSSLEKRMASWLHMLEFSLNVGFKFRIGLDLNPSNFGFDPKTKRVFYLDDEIYQKFSWKELGESLVSRISEEPQCSPGQWAKFGIAVNKVLLKAKTGPEAWDEVRFSIESYPLSSAFNESKTAFLGTVGNFPHKAKRVPRYTLIFADVHANLPALESLLSFAAEQNIQDFICLGDLVGYGPHPKECVQRIMQMKNCQCIMGNHDYMISSQSEDGGINRVARESIRWTRDQLDAEEMTFLKNLPTFIQKDEFLAIHGAPMDPQRFFAYVYELTYRENLDFMEAHQHHLVFYGHTHIPTAYSKVKGKYETNYSPKSLVIAERPIWLVNPGSIGQPRDGDTRLSFMLWDRQEGTIHYHRLEYDIQKTTQDLEARGLPEDLIFRLEMGR